MEKKMKMFDSWQMSDISAHNIAQITFLPSTTSFTLFYAIFVLFGILAGNPSKEVIKPDNLGNNVSENWPAVQYTN